MTQVYRALNKIRIHIMKDYGSDSRAYRQLKKYWKLLLKDETTLNYTDFRKRRNYRYAYLTNQEVIDHLLALSPELRSIKMCYTPFGIRTSTNYKGLSQQVIRIHVSRNCLKT